MIKTDSKMKLYKLLLAGTAIFVLSACQNLPETNSESQPIINFVSTIEQTNSPITKTSYSGDVINGWERIDWTKGDKVKIFMYSHNPSTDWDSDVQGQVYTIVTITPEDKKSIGRVYPDSGDPLIWKENTKTTGKYIFDFYSVYPQDMGGDFKVDAWNPNPKLTFNLPAKQNGSMANAFMAAVATGYSYADKDKNVILDYDPLVTTLWLSLKNDSPAKTELTIKEVRLESQQNSLAGEYYAEIRGGKWVVNDSNNNGNKKITLSIEKTVEYGDVVEIPIFLHPKEYSTQSLNLSVVTSLNGERHIITNSLGTNKNNISKLESCKKYNISLNLSGGGIYIEEPKFDIPPAAQQMIGAFIGYGNSGGGMRDLLYEYFKDLYPDSNEFQNKIWNRFLTEVRAKLPDVAAEDFNMFTETEWSRILQMMSELTKLEVNNGDYINQDLTPDDFKIFPNLEEIELLYERNVTIHISGSSTLKKITIKGNGKVNLTVDNCPELTTVTMSDGNKNKGSQINVDSATCPKYKP